jgi:putative tryptophan/tyrosine transport system substrate-binding protein
MRRREFVILLGATATRSRIARAQQAPKIAKIGVLYPGLAAALSLRMTAFRDGLLGAGYREPDNIELIPRAANSDPARIAALAAELAERKIDVILAVSRAAVRASQAASATIPIIALDLESDPVASGLIKSLSRPGGQVTGMFLDFPEFSKKWLELLKETMPGLTKVAVLWDPATGPVQKTGVEIAGEALNVNTLGLRLPAVTLFPEFARVGGLMSYGVDPDDNFRKEGATLVAKVLRGAKPAELPAELPTKFLLVINLKTARDLGITFPPSILVRADEVIE